MIKLTFKATAYTILCCIVSAAITTEASAIKILSRTSSTANSAPTSSASQHDDYKSDNNTSSSKYSNSSYNARTNNTEDTSTNEETPYSETNHLTQKEVSNFANTVGAALACMSDENDKKAVKAYFKAARGIMLAKVKTKQEFTDAMKHYSKTLKRSHKKQTNKGSYSCAEILKKLKRSALNDVDVDSEGNVTMPDGTVLLFDESKLDNF